jgi:hypothetical protein
MTEEYWWATTRSGAVMLRPIRFRCVGLGTSTGLLLAVAHITLNSDLRKTRIAPELPQRMGGVSTFHQNSNEMSVFRSA